MALTIGRIGVDDAGTRDALRTELEGIGSPAGRDFRIDVQASPGDGAWEVTVEGPRRLRPADADWSLTLSPGGQARYRRSLHGGADRSVRGVRNAVRQLVWEDIEIRDNAVRAQDAEMAEALEQVVWDILPAYDLPPLHVRFGAWRGDPGSPRFVCKVEAKTLGEAGVPPWRWWSPLVASADELSQWLQDVLQRRSLREASQSVPAGPPALVRPQAAVASMSA